MGENPVLNPVQQEIYMNTLTYINKGAKASITVIGNDIWNIDVIESHISSKGYVKKLMDKIKEDALSMDIKRLTLLSSIYNAEYFEIDHNFYKIDHTYDGIIMEYTL